MCVGGSGPARLTPPGLPSEGFPSVLGLEVKAIRGPGEALRGGRDPPPRQLHCRESGPEGKFRSGPKRDAVGSPGTPSPGDVPWSHTLIPGPRLPRNGASTKKRAPLANMALGCPSWPAGIRPPGVSEGLARNALLRSQPCGSQVRA